MEEITSELTQINIEKEEKISDANTDTQPTNVQTYNVKRSGDSAESKTMLKRPSTPTKFSKNNCGLGIKHHAIKKRHLGKLKEFTNIKSQDLYKYCEDSLKNFKPSALETIEEEPSNPNEDAPEAVNFLNTCKVKRFVTFPNNKPDEDRAKKRRAKVMATFGQSPSLNKMSMDEFLKKFKNNENDNEEDDKM